MNALLVCEPYLEGKMTMRPFKAKGYRVKEVLDLIHTDLCRPMSTSARGGYKYFITFIDDYSRYGYIYLMCHESVAFEKFKEYKTEVENHRGKIIKSLRSDLGGEYLLGKFRQYLKDHGITSQMFAHNQPQHNGVVEEESNPLRHGLSMISYTSLPNFFWGYALETSNTF